MYENADVEKSQAPMDPRELKRSFEGELRESKIPAGGDYCQTARPMSSEEIVAELFKYHAPNETTIPKFAAINQAAKNFAEVILANCPSGADRSTAINWIRMSRMLANAAIALNGLSLY